MKIPSLKDQINAELYGLANQEGFQNKQAKALEEVVSKIQSGKSPTKKESK